MPVHDINKSILAMQECMDFLGIKAIVPESPYTFTVIEANGRSFNGTATGKFRNDLHSHQGTYLEFDETILGYGINFEVFKPQFQTIIFIKSDTDNMLGFLIVQNTTPKYSFKLQVKK